MLVWLLIVTMARGPDIQMVTREYKTEEECDEQRRYVLYHVKWNFPEYKIEAECKEGRQI